MRGRHPDAVAEIEARFGAEAYPRRILMADLPQGSRIIPNPFNRIPGFTLGHHHFLPGFPQMAWPMMDWVLDTLYPEIRNQAPAAEAIITVHDVVESQLLDVMNEFVQRYPDVRFSCLPHMSEDNTRRLEFSTKGTWPRVAEAMAWLKKQVEQAGYRLTENPR
jgi:molybdopterin-biosynthesis enzyme MoeA-like protein